jgi:hypothetical protein
MLMLMVAVDDGRMMSAAHAILASVAIQIWILDL